MNNKQNNWKEDYWKLWGHLKDTPMVKNVLDFITQTLIKELEELKMEKAANPFYQCETIDNFNSKIQKRIEELRKI